MNKKRKVKLASGRYFWSDTRNLYTLNNCIIGKMRLRKLNINNQFVGGCLLLFCIQAPLIRMDHLKNSNIATSLESESFLLFQQSKQYF